MRKLGTRVVKVADLQVTAFVRKALDEGHAMALAELIETGVEMSDRIEITDMGIPNSIVNGRHRKEAYELAKVKEVTVDVLSFESQTELLAYAYRANTGGSLPPTREDTELVVMTLVDSGEKPKRIGELLGLPPSLIRRYTADLQTKRARTKLAQAAAAVTDGGLTVAKAADQFEVDLEQLKELLSGRRKKQRRNGIGDLQRDLTKLYKSVASKNASTLVRLRQQLEDGEVTKAQVDEFVDHLASLQKKSARSLSDWKARLAELTPANGKKK